MNSKKLDDYNLLTKTACVNNTKKCNIEKPYSYMELYGKNKSTSEYFTKLEREHLVKQYNDKCNKPNENLIKCCDANDNRINNVDNYIDEKLKNKFSKIKINRDREGI